MLLLVPKGGTVRFPHNPMVYDKESTVWNAVRIVVHAAPRLQSPVPSLACLMASLIVNYSQYKNGLTKNMTFLLSVSIACEKHSPYQF
jgi:hypothetical protein